MKPTLDDARREFPLPVRYRSVKESASYVGCHVQTLRRAFRNGEIDGFRRGRSIVFRTEDLDKWMARFFRPAEEVGRPATGCTSTNRTEYGGQTK